MDDKKIVNTKFSPPPLWTSIFGLSCFLVIILSAIILFPRNPKTPQISPILPTPYLTQSWKTFTNRQDSFEFQYPDNWEEFGTGSSDGYFKTKSDNLVILSVVSDNSKTIAEYLQKKDLISQTAYEGQPSVVVQSTKITIINGLNCIQRQEYLNAAGFTQISTYFKKGSLVISITLQSLNENTDEDKLSYDRLLSTFKFTNQNTTQNINKSCNQDQDCLLLTCSGCFNKEWAKTAPPDLPCLTYSGYSCRCSNNICINTK